MYRPYRMGWIPGLRDIRDYTADSPTVATALKKAKMSLDPPRPATLPINVDLREWCSPIEDQGQIGSCTAQAGVGLFEYFERKALGHHLDASRLFLYKATRNLLHWTGDTGAFLRTTMGAMALFGVPPESYWPYDADRFDEEPPAFCYAFAQNYQALKYFRLDPIGTPPDQVLARIRYYLASGFPTMLGFTVYSSIWQIETSGEIPLPTPDESVDGGHAIVAVGYDDEKEIVNPNDSRVFSKGAFLIRNSWGTEWGMNGYGWLPYDYVTSGLADDWWTLVKAEWIETGVFGL
jgi:C1A family cysteine protease